jgi:hypothetical protein
MKINNNARVGFTFQKCICDKYGIVPSSQEAIHQFLASYDIDVKTNVDPLIDAIFNSLKSNPVKCTTFSTDDCGEDVPYNFILLDNSTLSIRTNMKGCKIAPRKIGQAGFKKINDTFGTMFGKAIVDQNDIKLLISERISDMLPIFFEHLFDADYIIWIYNDGENFKYHLIRGDAGVDIEYKKEYFSFTRNYDKWTESTTLKYKGVSIAEIQVHKARSFKFRFVMNNVIPLLVAKSINNETLGVTAEKTICDLYGLETPPSFLRRYSIEMQSHLAPVIQSAFTILPKAIKHTGHLKGERGGDSKCSYDFVLEGNKTLSVKTNIGNMVCPPEVGQPSAETCFLYFCQFTNEDHMDGDIFKKMVYEHINEMLPIYLKYLFDSDYLLWLYKKKEVYMFKILDAIYANKFVWNYSKISFTKSTIEDWNESNTLKYDGTTIGEFQVHKNRDCLKFRFSFENLLSIIEKKRD